MLQSLLLTGSIAAISGYIYYDYVFKDVLIDEQPEEPVEEVITLVDNWDAFTGMCKFLYYCFITQSMKHVLLEKYFRTFHSCDDVLLVMGRWLPGFLICFISAYVHTHDHIEWFPFFAPWYVDLDNVLHLFFVYIAIMILSFKRNYFHAQCISKAISRTCSSMTHVTFLIPVLLMQAGNVLPFSSITNFVWFNFAMQFSTWMQLAVYYVFLRNIYEKIYDDKRETSGQFWIFLFNLCIISALATFSRVVLVTPEKEEALFDYHHVDMIRLFSEYVVFCVILDFIGYWAHRLQHIGELYTKLSHEIHHIARHPTAIEGVASDPLDFINPLLCGLVARIITDKIFPVNTWIESMMRLDTACVWCLCQHYGLIYEGISICLFFPFWGSTMFGEECILHHDIHHVHGEVNFGYTPINDIIFGTKNNVHQKVAEREEHMKEIDKASPFLLGGETFH